MKIMRHTMEKVCKGNMLFCLIDIIYASRSFLHVPLASKS